MSVDTAYKLSNPTACASEVHTVSIHDEARTPPPPPLTHETNPGDAPVFEHKRGMHARCLEILQARPNLRAGVGDNPVPRTDRQTSV